MKTSMAQLGRDAVKAVEQVTRQKGFISYANKTAKYVSIKIINIDEPFTQRRLDAIARRLKKVHGDRFIQITNGTSCTGVYGRYGRCDSYAEPKLVVRFTQQ